MRIKKKHRNQYINTDDGVWVRNFCDDIPAVDINNLTKGEEKIFLDNETANLRQRNLQLGEINWPNIVIVSDGLDLQSKQAALAELPYQDVKIIAVNGALRQWKLIGNNPIKRALSMYVVNNPYPESLAYLPTTDYFPNCVASTRTNPAFLKKYQGQNFFYRPAVNLSYSAPMCDVEPVIDDYRNPICAAISLAWKFRVKKLLLFCCDDSFREDRPAAVKLENGFYSYEPQLMSQRIIDAHLYWLSQTGVAVGSHSSGLNYKNAAYIPLSNLKEFFS